MLCLVTGPAASRADWAETIRAVVAAGVDWVQVRDRSLSGGALLAFTRLVAQAGRAGAARRGGEFRVLVNRRADVAVAAPTDGLHLGFDALALADARRLFAELSGPGIVGIATHSATEACEAAAEGADYAHLAPVFDPLSKPRERPPLGPEGIARARAALGPQERFRLIAQGGLDAGTAAAALSAGADGVAVTGAVLGATHPADAVARLRATLDG